MHSWGFVAMAKKHRDGRSKRLRSEVNPCPWYHSFIGVCMFAGLISSSSAWLPSPYWCLERAPRDHRRSPMHEPTRCYCHGSSLKSNMQHITLRCTGIGLWEVTCHYFVSNAALEDPKDPSCGHEDGHAWSRSDLRWFIGSSVLCFLMSSARRVPLEWLPLRHAPLEPSTEAYEIIKTVTFS